MQREIHNMKPEVIPAILAKSEIDMKRRLTLMEPLVPVVQIDVMDGSFVKNETWHDAKKVAKWKKNLKYELHLMVNNPIDVVNRWLKVRGLTRVIFHAETPQKLGHLIDTARRHKLEVGVAVSPGTPLTEIKPFMNRIDMVLVMGGKPGRSGRGLDKKMLSTVKTLRKRYPKLPIGFDISVNRRTTPELVHAGVTRLYTASAVFRTTSPAASLARLQTIADKACNTH